MNKSITLKMEPWVIIVGVVLTAAAGWMLFQGTMMGPRAGAQMHQMAMPSQMQHQMMGQMTTMMDHALTQADTALNFATIAADAADVPSAQSNLQQALDTLQKGDMSLHSYISHMSAMMENEKMQGMMSSMPMMDNMSPTHSDMVQMMNEVEKHLTSATDHFGLALNQESLESLKPHVAEGIRLLELIRGSEDTGGLLKMKAHHMMNMNQMEMMSS